jgi:hypothetical protein
VSPTFGRTRRAPGSDIRNLRKSPRRLKLKGVANRITDRQPKKKLRLEELELQRVKLFVEFAKYGFAGTLAAALVGMGVIVTLACLQGQADKKVVRRRIVPRLAARRPWLAVVK